jgi:cellobiose epimerase
MLNTQNIKAVDTAKLCQEFRTELIAIADWWLKYSVDHEQGGFYGEVDANNQPVPNASKGIILNARILWFFSETARETGIEKYRVAAERAYTYVSDYFFDPLYGGVYWELEANGNPLNTKKQVYAQAFTIYALSAYYQLTKEKSALSKALACFFRIAGGQNH